MTTQKRSFYNHLFFLICLLGVGTVSYGQQHDDDEHDHHKNEFGIANAPVYYLKEKEWAYGFHAHLTRNLGESKFGIGLGYERIFDEHRHNTFGIVGTYRPFHQLSINAAPGITFEDVGGIRQSNFALHLETAYEFEIGNFHIGPVAEIAYDPEDYHFSLGIHIGYGF